MTFMSYELHASNAALRSGLLIFTLTAPGCVPSVSPVSFHRSKLSLRRSADVLVPFIAFMVNIVNVRRRNVNKFHKFSENNCKISVKGKSPQELRPIRRLAVCGIFLRLMVHRGLAAHGLVSLFLFITPFADDAGDDDKQ